MSSDNSRDQLTTIIKTRVAMFWTDALLKDLQPLGITNSILSYQLERFQTGTPYWILQSRPSGMRKKDISWAMHGHFLGQSYQLFMEEWPTREYHMKKYGMRLVRTATAPMDAGLRMAENALKSILW